MRNKMKIIKGRRYVMFGNLPHPDSVAQELKDKLDITVEVMLSNTDNVTFVEFEDTDSELVKLRADNIKLKQKLSKRFF